MEEQQIPKFYIGQEVYLKTDPEQNMRLITGIVYRQDNIQYMCALSSDESLHYDFEISNHRQY